MPNKYLTLINKDANYLSEKLDFNNFFDGVSILITGASGLVGINFLSYFSRLKMMGIKIKITGVINSDSTALIKNFASMDGISILKGDLTDSKFVNTIKKHDIIIHAAGFGQPGKFLKNKIPTIQLNTTCTLSLFSLLEKNGSFLYVSTSEVYSGNKILPHKEEYIGTTDPYHPRASYIEAKRAGETICNIYREMGINACSARLSLAYGPGTKAGDQRVINQFIQRAIQTKKISLQDMGEALRTYCYITDAIEIMLNIIYRGNKSVYNVAGESRTSIADLAKEIGSILKVPVKFPSNVLKKDDAPEDVSSSLELIKKDFGKDEFIPLDVGLKNTIEWQKQIYKRF
jgi:UDP-glucuronate decarboxylase